MKQCCLIPLLLLIGSFFVQGCATFFTWTKFPPIGPDLDPFTIVHLVEARGEAAAIYFRADLGKGPLLLIPYRLSRWTAFDSRDWKHVKQPKGFLLIQEVVKDTMPAPQFLRQWVKQGSLRQKSLGIRNFSWKGYYLLISFDGPPGTARLLFMPESSKGAQYAYTFVTKPNLDDWEVINAQNNEKIQLKMREHWSYRSYKSLWWRVPATPLAVAFDIATSPIQVIMLLLTIN